jgi:hypothetical protein
MATAKDVIDNIERVRHDRMTFQSTVRFSPTRSVIVPWKEFYSPAQDIKLGRETQKGCDSECDHVQYLYRFKNGFGVSLAANHMTRTYWRNYGYMEAVVIYFPDPDTDDFEFVYMNTEADEPVLEFSSFSDYRADKLCTNDLAGLESLWGTGLMLNRIKSQFQHTFQNALKEVKSL